jgi:hypothetical protein
MSEKTNVTFDGEPGKTYLILIPPLGSKLVAKPIKVESLRCTSTITGHIDSKPDCSLDSDD